MKINVEIKRVYIGERQPLLANANIIFDDAFIIKNVKLVRTKTMFVTMPSLRGRSDRWFSACHPTTSEFRRELQDAYVEAYRDYLDENGLTEPKETDSTESEPED